MSVEISCNNCFEPLEDGNNDPCPVCGSLTRNYKYTFSDNISVSDSGSFTHEHRSEPEIVEKKTINHKWFWLEIIIGICGLIVGLFIGGLIPGLLSGIFFYLLSRFVGNRASVNLKTITHRIFRDSEKFN